MENFCIVKRRKPGFTESFPPPLPLAEESPSFPESFNPAPSLQLKEGAVLSLSLTQGQCRAIRNGGILSLLDTENPKNLSLTIQQQPDGQVVFNFHFDFDRDWMMLKADQVCQMMQISRNSLNRLVKENRLKSHKIGRLRRFRFKEIVEALNRSLA